MATTKSDQFNFLSDTFPGDQNCQYVRSRHISVPPAEPIQPYFTLVQKLAPAQGQGQQHDQQTVSSMTTIQLKHIVITMWPQ